MSPRPVPEAVLGQLRVARCLTPSAFRPSRDGPRAVLPRVTDSDSDLGHWCSCIVVRSNLDLVPASQRTVPRRARDLSSPLANCSLPSLALPWRRPRLHCSRCQVLRGANAPGAASSAPNLRHRLRIRASHAVSGGLRVEPRGAGSSVAVFSALQRRMEDSGRVCEGLPACRQEYVPSRDRRRRKGSAGEAG